MAKPYPNCEFELVHKKAGRGVVGVDEVGRGCLAGPVVTAAVVLPDFILTSQRPLSKPTEPSCKEWWWSLTDSKLVKPSDRETLAKLIWEEAMVQVAWCLPEEIDRWNILQASLKAMRRALRPFAGIASAVLVDGNQDPFKEKFCHPHEERGADLGFTHIETIVKGDQRSLSIAAASIVAKVYRDRWMSSLDKIFPAYAFEKHKGYPTPVHKSAIQKHGPCTLHRRSFNLTFT